MKRMTLLSTLALAGCFAQPGLSPTTETATPAEPVKPIALRDLTKAERDILAKGLAASLKDPDSAKFRWGQIPVEPDAKGLLDYCGMVNAKNSYGGYVGFKPFFAIVAVEKGKIFHGAIGALASSRPGDEEIIVKMCRDKGLNPYSAS